MKIPVQVTGPDWMSFVALIELSTESQKDLLRKREIFQTLYDKEGHDLDSLVYWGMAGDFYADGDLKALLTAEQQQGLEHDNHLIVPDDFEINAAPARTKCDRLFVDQTSFYWRAIPKHTDLYIETCPLSFDILLAAKGNP
jgi:hypothetical protein